MNAVDLSGGWTTLWGKINTGDFASVMTLLTIIGVALVIFSAVSWIWSKRRGGAPWSGVLWAAIVGGILVSPNVLIPWLLQLVDLIVNAVVRLGQ